jgi:hypothetical protein
MKQELIDLVRELKEVKKEKDFYLASIPSDLSVSVFDNKYVELLEMTIQILTNSVFHGVEEDVYWFLYDFEAGRSEGPHIIDATGKEWFIRSDDDYYEYLKGVE